jgi:two-component sensor histidine kinase/PAS domain-containing protein
LDSTRLTTRRFSTPFYLFALVAAVAVPLLLFGALLLMRYAVNERARIEGEAMQIARQVALVIDGELEGLVASLRGLGASSALARGDLVEFHAEAKRLVEGDDAIVVLRDLSSRQFLNTQRPFGTELPPAVPLSSAEQAAFSAGRPRVSEVYASPLSGEPRVAVALPIARGGASPYLLAITVPTSRLRDALTPAVPAGWTVGVADRNGTYVTRSARHEDFTGKSGLAEYLSKAVGRSGTFASVNFEGTQLVAGYYRSNFSDWLFGANVPQQMVEAPLWRSLTLVAVLAAGVLALAALLAYMFGRRVTAATAELVDRAVALGKGQPVAPMPASLAEFAVLGDALAAAAATVEERARERARAAEREALLGGIFDAAGLYVGVVELLGDDYRYVVANHRIAARFGRSETGVEGARASELGLRPQEIHERLELCRRCIAAGGPLTVEYGFPRGGVEQGWYLATFTSILPGRSGLPRIAFTALDISERKRSEEQRLLLINELNHRVKNTLASVQSIALQTLRGAGAATEIREALTARLVALARAHDVLTRESWEGAGLHDIVAGATSPYGGPDRFRVGGPSVWLTPSLSLSLALALHELATNAAKYGALSAERGTVAVTWEIADALRIPRLTLRWVEHGGPRVRAPTRQGFGSRLIQRSLAAEIEGAVTIDYAPEGVICVIQTTIRQGSAPLDTRWQGDYKARNAFT